jgi:hypothetical protein
MLSAIAFPDFSSRPKSQCSAMLKKSLKMGKVGFVIPADSVLASHLPSEQPEPKTP